MMPSWRSAMGSAGVRRSTSRKSFSALSYCSAAKASLARARIWSVVGSPLEQPAATSASSASIHIGRRLAGETILVPMDAIEVALCWNGPDSWLCPPVLDETTQLWQHVLNRDNSMLMSFLSRPYGLGNR